MNSFLFLCHCNNRLITKKYIGGLRLERTLKKFSTPRITCYDYFEMHVGKLGFELNLGLTSCDLE